MADFNPAPYYAAGRHILSASAGAVGMLAAMHLITGDEAGRITDAFHQIGSGIASITAGVTTLVGIASALYASWSATHKSQIAAVAAMPEVKQIVTTPTVAAESPSAKVTAG